MLNLNDTESELSPWNTCTHTNLPDPAENLSEEHFLEMFLSGVEIRMSEFRLEAPTLLNLCSRSEVRQAERCFKAMSVTGVDSTAQAEYRQEHRSVACLPETRV